MSDLPWGTVTMLFTDIEGSTRLLQQLGRDDYVRALTIHRRLVREAFTRHGGVEVEMQGDSFFFAFADASGAVAAAADAQLALSRHDWGSETIRVRIGIHTGEPVLSEGLYAGLDVHRAARVMSAGHGGQVVLSQATRELIEDEFGGRDLGLHRLKDLSEPVRLYQLGEDDFPPLKTLDATNLPIAAGPLLGREQELAELIPLFQNGTRLLSITGPGGTGKTRLALQVAAELTGSFADGVFWVPLAGLDDPELVLPAISQTIGAAGELSEHLRGKQLLLLLDNAEHLITVAPALAELLRTSSTLRLLVTSRAPLRVAAEAEYPLEPLTTTNAMALFVERARALGRVIEADATLEAICRRLDGLPLAVELAAARVRFVDPTTLLERLERALPLLTDGARDAPERQRTLRATMEWSYELLEGDARRLLAAVSVFAGSFSLNAAETVCDAELDLLAALAEMSLLKPIGGSRFLMLETIREFGLEKLDELSARDVLRSRHADFYLGIAEEGEPALTGAEDREWLGRLDPDRDNFRAAFVFAQEQGRPELALRLVSALRWYWSARGRIAELRRWLEEALEQAGDALPEQRADALQAAALSAYWAGDYDETESYARQMLDIVRRLGDREREVSALTKLGAAASGREDLEQARLLMEQALVLARELGKPARLALSLSNCAEIALQDGDFTRAAELCEEGLLVGERELDSSGLSMVLLNLSEARLRLGDRARAAESASEALELAASRSDPLLVSAALLALAPAVAGGDAPGACRLLGAAAALREETGAGLGPSELRQSDELVESLRRTVGDVQFDQAYDEGRALAFTEAVELGLESRVGPSSV
jgi:predicted ATPase/class 3 adenylate cyclase